jgi:hypothetical protein
MNFKERQFVRRLALGGVSAVGLAAALSPLAAVGTGQKDSVLLTEKKSTPESIETKKEVIFDATPNTIIHDASIPRYPHSDFGSYEEHEKPRK